MNSESEAEAELYAKDGATEKSRRIHTVWCVESIVLTWRS